VTWFADYAFTIALKMTSSMTLIPYLLVAAFGLQLALRGETYDADPHGRTIDIVRSAIATLYAAGMIYAGGTKFLLLSAILYAPGTALFVLARREQRKQVFTFVEAAVFASIVTAAAVGLYGLVSGAISI
jgi:arginine:ornithine antiporter / lysine permease